MANMKVKKGDTVVVLTGKENGKTAEVLECFPKEGKVTVKGLNMIVKHNKPKSAQDKGGIVRKEGKIDCSNVMVVCPNCNKATRISMSSDEKGNKVRVCKKCGAILDAKKVRASKKEDKKAETSKKTTSKKVAKEDSEVKVTKTKEVKSTEKKAKSTSASKKSTTKKATVK